MKFMGWALNRPATIEMSLTRQKTAARRVIGILFAP